MNMPLNKYSILLAVVLFLVASATRAETADTSTIAVGSDFPASDTLAPGDEQNQDSKACLKALCWNPTKFNVRVEAAEPDRGDFLIRFPSPRPIGDATNDQVSMEWYAARDANGAIRTARAVVIVHESAHSMPV